MQVICTRKELIDRLELVGKKHNVGLVMTMGCLHEGHGDLVRRSVAENELTLVSIYVNEAQFAPDEDFDRYPRRVETDVELCRQWGADVVFTPRPGEVYDTAHDTWVNCGVGDATRNVNSEGFSRPSFFRGVATMVTKMLCLTHAHRCYFGLKDAQQCAVVRRIVVDLWLRTEVILVETRRSSDGLALSSRNEYLSPAIREQAAALSMALTSARSQWSAGLRNVVPLRRGVESHLRAAGLTPLYISVCARWTMRETDGVAHGAVLLCAAASVGTARLVDNVVLDE